MPRTGLRLNEPEEAEPDPTDSLIRRAKKRMDDSKLIEAAIRWGVIAILGSGAGFASHKVTDAREDVEHSTSVADIAHLKQEIQNLRSEREAILKTLRDEENEREADVEKLRDRVLFLEARTGIRIDPPAAAAATAPPETPNP